MGTVRDERALLVAAALASTSVTARVAGKSLESALPEWIPETGRAGVSVAASGRVEVREFKVSAPKASPKAKAPKVPAKKVQ